MIINDRYERRRLKMLAEAVEGGTVLDVGYSQLPNPFFRGVTVTGIDLEPPRGEVPYDETFTGDVAELAAQFPDRTFDTVVAGELIEHLEDPYGFLRSVRSVLSPTGLLVISTPNPVSFPVIIAEWIQSDSFFYTADHTFYFPPRWVTRLLQDSGYDVIEQRPVGLWTPMVTIPWCPTALSYQVIYCARPRPLDTTK